MCVKSLQSHLTLGDPIDCCPPGSSVHGDSPDKNIGVGAMPSSRDLPHPEIGLMSPVAPVLQVDSLPLALPQKPN